MKTFEKDLSQGSVFKQLMMFALPFIISNLIQTLYSVADMVIVGQFSGTLSMSGVNIGSQLTLLVTNLVIGLGSGATVLIAQYLGKGAKKELHDTIATLLTTLIVLAVFITVVMEILSTPCLRLIRTPAESFSEAKSYFVITMYGTFFIFGYNALSAVMRGLGDSKNPLIFVTIACFVNIGLDLLLVAKLHMGAGGAALATVISQAVSMILCVVYLKKNNFVFDFKIKSFGFNKERFRMLMKIGIPTSLQNIIVSLSFTVLTAIVNTLGVTASAALGAVGKYNAFAILPCIAMSASIAAMSAQNIGAGQIDRAKKTMKVGILIAMIMSFAVFALTRLCPVGIMRIFTNDAEMIRQGLDYLASSSYDFLIVPFFFGLGGLFIGTGHTTFSLINSLTSSILVRVPASYIFGITLKMGMNGIGYAAPVATVVSLIMALIFYFSGKWKKTVILNELEAE